MKDLRSCAGSPAPEGRNRHVPPADVGGVDAPARFVNSSSSASRKTEPDIRSVRWNELPERARGKVIEHLAEMLRAKLERSATGEAVGMSKRG